MVMDFVEVLVASIGGTTVVLLAVGFLAKKWIGTRIVQSIKTVYAKELEDWKHVNAKTLEEFKRHLEEQTARKQEELAADRAMFQRFLKALPSNGSIDFVRNHDFGGCFDRRRLEQLETFAHEWNDAEHEFLNSEMETKRSELHSLAKTFLGMLVTYASPLAGASGEHHSSLPREWEDNNRAAFQKAVTELHEQANKVVAAHQNLVRLGKQHLML
jgi:hypothetical protein